MIPIYCYFEQIKILYIGHYEDIHLSLYLVYSYHNHKFIISGADSNNQKDELHLHL